MPVTWHENASGGGTITLTKEDEEVFEVHVGDITLIEYDQRYIFGGNPRPVPIITLHANCHCYNIIVDDIHALLHDYFSLVKITEGV